MHMALDALRTDPIFWEIFWEIWSADIDLIVKNNPDIKDSIYGESVYWKKSAAWYDGREDGFDTMAKDFVDFSQIRAWSRILDLWAGTWICIDQILQYNPKEIIPVDPSIYMLRELDKKYWKNKKISKIIHGTIQGIQDEIDVIISHWAYIHAIQNSPVDFLRDWLELLSPNWKFCFSYEDLSNTKVGPTPWNIFHEALLEATDCTMPDINFPHIPIDDIYMNIEQAGWKIIKQDTVAWDYPSIALVNSFKKLTSKRTLSLIKAMYNKSTVHFWTQFRFIIEKK